MPHYVPNKYPNIFGCNIFTEQIYLYSANSMNTNTNHIWGSFYLNIDIFVLITN